jgi:hypothetical protein
MKYKLLDLFEKKLIRNELWVIRLVAFVLTIISIYPSRFYGEPQPYPRWIVTSLVSSVILNFWLWASSVNFFRQRLAWVLYLFLPLSGLATAIVCDRYGAFVSIPILLLYFILIRRLYKERVRYKNEKTLDIAR